MFGRFPKLWFKGRHFSVGDLVSVIDATSDIEVYARIEALEIKESEKTADVMWLLPRKGRIALAYLQQRTLSFDDFVEGPKHSAPIPLKAVHQQVPVLASSQLAESSSDEGGDSSSLSEGDAAPGDPEDVQAAELLSSLVGGTVAALTMGKESRNSCAPVEDVASMSGDTAISTEDRSAMEYV